MKNIIFLRLSALGDLVHCLPLYHCVLNQNPNATIHWVVDARFAQLIKNLPNIQVHKVDKTNIKTLIQSALKIRKKLKDTEIELLINTHDSMSANITSLFLPRPKLNIGLNKNQARDMQFLFVKQTAKSENLQQHAVEQNLNLARTLKIKPSYNFDLGIKKNNLQVDKNILINLSVSNAHLQRGFGKKTYQFILINLCKKLCGDKNYVIHLTGENTNLTSEIALQLLSLEVPKNIKIKNWVGRTNLSKWLDLVKKSSLIISPDSAAVHLADSLNIACLSIYLATNPKKIGPFNRCDYCLNFYPIAREKFLNPTDKWDKKIKVESLEQIINENQLKNMIDLVVQKELI